MKSAIFRFIVAAALVWMNGCASDGGGNGYVFTGSSGESTTNGPSGPMTFHFVTAQAPLAVPTGTTLIRFRFYSDPDGRGTSLQQELRDFAPTITIDPVNQEARSVEITARDGSGFPLLEAVVNVAPGQDVIVDFTGAETRHVSIEALLISPSTLTIAPLGTQQFTARLLFSNGENLPADNVAWVRPLSTQATF